MGKFKVCHLVYNYLPFSQNWLYRQINSLEDFDPTVLAYGEIVNRRHFPLKNLDHAYRVTAKEADAAHYYLEHGCWPQMSRHIEKFKPVLLHAHFGINGVAALNLKAHFKLPLITSFYGYDLAVKARKPYWRRAYQRLFEQADLFLAEGPHMRRLLKQLGCPARKIIVQRLGVDLEKIKYVKPNTKDQRLFKVLMVGRMVEKKGHLCGLRSFALLAQQEQSARLTVIGDGDMLEQVKSLAEELAITDKVIFAGNLAYNDYLRQMSKHHVLLQPSQTASDGDTEGGAPVSLLEAQAMGLAIVATRHADIPAYVAEGSSGLLANEQDVRQLSAHLIRLATSPRLVREMGLKGRERIKSNYNLSDQRLKLASIYQRMMSSSHPVTTESPRIYYLPFLKDAATIFNLSNDDAAHKKALELILRLDKRNLSALSNLAKIYTRQGRTSKRITCWRDTLVEAEAQLVTNSELAAFTAEAAFNLGLGYSRQKKIKSAIDAYQKAIAYDPQLWLAYYHLGSICKETGDLAKAKKMFEKIISNQAAGSELPAKALFHLGDILLRQKKPAMAVRYLRRCLEQLPHHQAAKDLLCEIEEGFNAKS